MGRPSKGERVQVTLRLPKPLVESIARLELVDRHAWLVGAIETKLKEAPYGERAQETPG